MYQYTSRQILLPSGGESAWRYKETRGVISPGRREMPPLYPTKPCFEHALLGFNFSLVVFNKYKRIERSSAGPDKYNLWPQLIFSVHTFVQSFCCQCFVYFCYSFVTLNHFNSDFHHVNISLRSKLSFRYQSILFLSANIKRFYPFTYTTQTASVPSISLTKGR